MSPLTLPDVSVLFGGHKMLEIDKSFPIYRKCHILWHTNWIAARNHSEIYSKFITILAKSGTQKLNMNHFCSSVNTDTNNYLELFSNGHYIEWLDSAVIMFFSCILINFVQLVISVPCSVHFYRCYLLAIDILS